MNGYVNKMFFEASISLQAEWLTLPKRPSNFACFHSYWTILQVLRKYPLLIVLRLFRKQTSEMIEWPHFLSVKGHFMKNHLSIKYYLIYIVLSAWSMLPRAAFPRAKLVTWHVPPAPPHSVVAASSERPEIHLSEKNVVHFLVPTAK